MLKILTFQSVSNLYIKNEVQIQQIRMTYDTYNYNMTVWIWAGNYISFTIAAGLIRLHMPGVKKSRV